MPNILQITSFAQTQIMSLIKQRGTPCLGVRIGVKTRGCSGLSYTLDFVENKNEFDEVVHLEEFSLFIDPKAVMFLLGTVMDYERTDLESGFKFINPNEKGRCGCGESFRV